MHVFFWFSLQRNGMESRNGGGVCAYIRNDISFTLADYLSVDDLESVWLELLLPKTKPIVIGTCYRPPKQNNFLEFFDTAFKLIRPECEVIILGDFNICMKNKISVLFKNYCNILNMFSLKQLIAEPTRITASSSSLIDHILCNNEDKVSQSGVIKVGISDHFLTFCTRKTTKENTGKQSIVRVRSMKHYSKEKFIEHLENADLSALYLCRNVNKAWEKFREIFHSSLDKVAPYKEIKVKQKTEPWMTSDILDYIRKRDIQLQLYKKSKSKHIYSDYCKLRNKVQKEVKKAKEEYISNKIEENKNNPKKLWQQLKGLGYSSKQKDNASVVLSVEGQNCHDLKEIANVFNNFFTTVAAKLVKKLPPCSPCPNVFNVSSSLFKQFYQKVTSDKLQIEIHAVDTEFVYKQICHLNSFKSTGIDDISARFIKDAAIVLTKPITYIINLSITSGIVPDELKSARVKPLFKKNSRTEVGNYRPVSILCIISKLLEKSVYKQLESYFIKNNLLYEFQSGFRSAYSTDTCLVHLFDHIKFQTARGLYTGMVMIDLQKAFDTVDHLILCSKLQAMGVKNIKWFESY